MTRSPWNRRMLAGCVALAMLAASCGGSDGGATAPSLPSADQPALSQPGESEPSQPSDGDSATEPGGRTVVTAETAGGTTSSTDAPGSTGAETGETGTGETSTGETSTGETSTGETGPATGPVDDDALRLAPARADGGETFRWDRSTVSPLGHSGIGDAMDLGAGGELVQVVAVPLAGFAFQTTDDRVIWHLEGDEPEALLVVPENERLTLEGAGLDQTGEAIVLYQRRVLAEPESTRSTLFSHRLNDGAVTEIAATGGWESGAGFPTLSPLGPGAGDTAVASWGAEGWEWLEIIDLTSGDLVFDSQNVSGDCFDGDPGCPSFWFAVPFAGDIVGMGPVWNEELGFVDAFGLWTYDTDDGELDLMQSWAWDNGAWYVEDMFVLDDSLLVVSLHDDPFRGEPLPPLFFDLVSGESWTLPEATFIRPAFLT